MFVSWKNWEIQFFFRDLLTFKVWVKNLAEFEVWNFLLFIDYSSGFLRWPKESDKISDLIWRLLDKFQINWAILSYFCCLLKKPELYKPLVMLKWIFSLIFFWKPQICIKIQTLISNSQDTLKYVLGMYLHKWCSTNFSL